MGHRRGGRCRAVVLVLGLLVPAAPASSATQAPPQHGALSPRPSPEGCVASGLAACLPGRIMDATSPVALSPDGRNVYAGASGQDAVVVLDRSADGSIVQKPGTDGCVALSFPSECAVGHRVQQPADLVVSPDGRHLYVAGRLALTAFERDPTTGVITQLAAPAGCYQYATSSSCTHVRSLYGAGSLALSADGRFLYVGVSSSGVGVVVLARDRTTGALSQLPGADGCVEDADRPPEDGCGGATGLSLVRSIELAPGGRHLYAAGRDSGNRPGAIVAFARDPGTGVLSQLPGTAGCTSATGHGGRCTVVAEAEGYGDLSVAPDGGHLYAVADLGSLLGFRRAPSGALERLMGPGGCVTGTAGLPHCSVATGLDRSRGDVLVGPDGRNVYVASTTRPFPSTVADGVVVLDRDRVGGGLVQKAGALGCVTPEPPCTVAVGLEGAYGLAFSPGGRQLYVGANLDDAVVVLDRAVVDDSPSDDDGPDDGDEPSSSAEPVSARPAFTG